MTSSIQQMSARTLDGQHRTETILLGVALLACYPHEGMDGVPTIPAAIGERVSGNEMFGIWEEGTRERAHY